MRYVAGLAAIGLAAVCFAVALLVPRPVSAEEAPHCYTVEEATKVMKEHKLEVFGDLPFGEGRAVYYREPNGHVFAAPIVDGCVQTFGLYVPGFVEPTRA